MAAPVNIFTHREFNDAFRDLSYNQTLPLTSIDLPYFAVRSFFEKRGKSPLEGADFKDPFKDTSDEGWAVLEGVDDSPSKQRDFEFLEQLALGFKKDDTYYVNKFADILYNQKYGLFSKYDSTRPKSEIKEWMTPLMRLFLTYILPGRWWRAFYARQYLPDTIGLTTMLNTEMLEIEDEWADIAAEYGMPPVESDAEPAAKS